MRSAINYALVIITFSAMIPLLIRCSPDVEVEMTYRMRIHVDTVVKERRQHIDSVYDSLCVVITDSLVERAYDSIFNERIKQMRKIQSIQ